MDVYIKAIFEGMPFWSGNPPRGNAITKDLVLNPLDDPVLPAGGCIGSSNSRYMTSFEERQAALADQVLRSTANVFEDHSDGRMPCRDHSEMQLQQYISQLLPSYGTSFSNLVLQQPQADIRTPGCFSNAVASNSRASADIGGGWQCAITNRFLGYDSLPDLLAENDQQTSDGITGTIAHRIHNYQFPSDFSLNETANSTDLMTISDTPGAITFNVNGVACDNGNMLLQRDFCLQNMENGSQTLESVVRGCINEPPAKRQRVSCYTLDDILKNLPQDAAGCNVNSSRFIIRSEPILPVSSKPPPCITRPETDSEEAAKSMFNSIEPQSIAARHRRKKISERISSLEKLIPGGSKLDTARMLEEAIKYVRFLQAQVHALECMSDSRDPSASSEKFMTPGLNLCGSSSRLNAFDHKRFITNVCNIGIRPNHYSLANSLLKKLSTQQMLHILVTSPAIQRKLYSAELCVCTDDQKRTLAGTEVALPYDF